MERWLPLTQGWKILGELYKMWSIETFDYTISRDERMEKLQITKFHLTVYGIEQHQGVQ